MVSTQPVLFLSRAGFPTAPQRSVSIVVPHSLLSRDVAESSQTISAKTASLRPQSPISTQAPSLRYAPCFPSSDLPPTIHAFQYERHGPAQWPVSQGNFLQEDTQ